MAHAARALGLGVMLGCMIESGLGIAAGCFVAPLCDHVDLDGNLLIADDPWPGVEFATASRCPPTGRGSVSEQPERLLILARGSPATRTTARPPAACSPTAQRPVVALLDSTRAAETQRGVPIVGSSRTRSLGSDDCARRRRDPGRPLPAGLARAAEEPISSRAARRERPARVPRRRPRAERAGRTARRRAARPAAAAPA